MYIPGYIHLNRTITITSRVNFGSYSLLDNVGEVSAAQPVPEHIPRPPYAETGQPPPPPASAELHSKEGIEAMRAACSLAVKAQNTVRKNIKV